MTDKRAPDAKQLQMLQLGVWCVRHRTSNFFRHVQSCEILVTGLLEQIQHTLGHHKAAKNVDLTEKHIPGSPVFDN